MPLFVFAFGTSDSVVFAEIALQTCGSFANFAGSTFFVDCEGDGVTDADADVWP
ncbi:hypothetical protein [Streptomyces sp. NPDC005828]|uniref:hypothetical protein n=1 Tax=Streptomyces sp. NPDC005828 TaxID=3157071 RepID=UPI003403B505